MPLCNRFIGHYRLLPLLLSFSFLATACVQTAPPTATMAPASTPAPPTATMTLPPTAAPPTATMTSAPMAALTTAPVIEIDLDMELPEGDPDRSQSRVIQFGCVRCHNQGARGPDFGASAGLPSILERGELRIADPAYQGNASTNREYIIESIFLPEVYVVAGNWPEGMPTDFAERLTEQDLADIFLWLGSFE
jgi:hypothetical protein